MRAPASRVPRKLMNMMISNSARAQPTRAVQSAGNAEAMASTAAVSETAAVSR